MPHLVNKDTFLKSVVLLIAIVPVFILPVMYNHYLLYLIFSIALISLSLITARKYKELFPTLLFFTLIHVSRPLNIAFVKLLGIEFAGTFFLIPLTVFTLLILTIPGIRKQINWWQRDTIDRKSWYIILGMSLVSGISLYVWGYFIADNLSYFTKNFPDVPLLWILINGFGFAVLNAIAEEFLARGMLYDGLGKIFTDKRIIIISQAVIFAIFHYRGFPGGIIGMVMVFIWSIALGIIRYRTKGLLGVLIGHFMADFTIYFIIYSLK